jgi:hypothetical protein
LIQRLARLPRQPARTVPMKLSHSKSEDRWMYFVATFAFFAMIAGALWWLHSINFFYFKATFPLSEFLGFFVCALIVVINIAMRIPMLLRWLRTKIRPSN